MKRKHWILLGAAAIVGVFGYLLYGGLDKNVVFFLTPKELLAKGLDGYDVPVRLGGMVKPGTIKWNAESLDLTFTMTDGNGDVNVRSKGAPPQMFRDNMGVVVEGRYNRSGVFQANNLMVRHSNEYHAPKPGERPKDMYKTLLTGDNK